MNRIKIDREFYTVARIGIIPYYKVSNTEYRILLQQNDDDSVYQDFFSFMKRSDNYENLLRQQIKKIAPLSVDKKLNEPIKKILNSTQKSIYLEWLVEVDPDFIEISSNHEWLKVDCDNYFEIEKTKFPLSCILESIKKMIVKKLEKC